MCGSICDRGSNILHLTRKNILLVRFYVICFIMVSEDPRLQMYVSTSAYVTCDFFPLFRLNSITGYGHLILSLYGI